MRRSKSLVFGALLSAMALIAAGCGGDGGGGGGDQAADCTWTIGTMGALSGDYASIGVPISQGVELAINEANAQGDLPCTLELSKQDSQGDPNQAPPLARQLAQQEDLVAVVGPYFSGETLASGPIFDQAGVPFITPSATDPSLAEQGWTTFFRAVANDAQQGPTAATYIKQALKPQSVAVIHDNSQYGKTLAGVVADELGGIVSGPFPIDPEETDYSAVVAQVKNANPDVVYFGGYAPQAGPLALQLQQGGVTGVFFSDDGTKDASFGDLAKGAAQGSLVTCPCADPTKLPAAQEFISGIQQEFNRAPGTFAADAFDATNIVIEALKEQDAGAEATDVRSGVIDYLSNVEGWQGITKTYTFDETGQVEVDPLENIWIYKWSNKAGDFVSIGPAAEAIKQ